MYLLNQQGIKMIENTYIVVIGFIGILSILVVAGFMAEKLGWE